MGLNKPSEKEEEYFARQMLEKRRREAEAPSTVASDEKRPAERRCPKCRQPLTEAELKGTTIDCCVNCQGDRKEESSIG